MNREPMNNLTIHKHREPNYLPAPKAADIYVPIRHHLYNCRENSTNHPILFKTNPISERPKMNAKSFNTVNYENIANCELCENKPNSNPISNATLLK
jgi:hypothetical protein